MATSKTPTTKPTPVKTGDEFLKVYVRLRTVLDAVEIGVINRCLQEQTVEMKIKRIEEFEKLLEPIIRRLKKDKPTRKGACAEGYYDCGGVCVPYQCPADK